MGKNDARPLILAATLLVCSVEAAPCADRAPATQPPAVNPATSPVHPALPSSLPSSVSSDIERFVTQGGRDLRPATPRPAITARAHQDLRDLPQPLPPPLSSMPGRSVPGQTPPSPLATAFELKAAPFEPTDLRFPINLATALRLSDARPLIVAAAQARVWVAEAELTRAKVLWVPTLNVAFDYIRHDGGGPDFNKGIMTAPSVNFFYGGAGVGGFLALADAIYEPLAARQVLNARQWDIQTAKNDALMQTAETYFLVHQYRGLYAGALYAVSRARDVLGRIAGMSRDLVPPSRSTGRATCLPTSSSRRLRRGSSGGCRAPRLTRVLRLDPRAVVEPLEHDHLQITLIDPALELDVLMPIALTNRPELASRRALIQAAEAGIRREKARPLLPIVILTGFQSPGGMLIQGGFFGLGPNSSLNQWSGRDDVSIQLVWQLESLGIGNLARIKAQRGQQSRAVIDLRTTQDMVAEEVNQAHANLQSAAARVVQADRSLRTGIIALNGSTEGLEQTSRFGNVLEPITRPQEAIYALQLLMKDFTEYYTTVAEYNRAQFELFHALGYPAREVACLRSTGDNVPVDTSRPVFLPRVGNGPPPATR